MTGPSLAGAGVRDRRRYVIAVGLMLVLTLGYIDRVSFSIAGVHIIQDFHLSTGDYGLLSSAFNWSYLLMLLPVGILADRVGSKVLLPAFMVIWSIGVGVTGLVTGVVGLILARLLLGIGESPINPAGNVIVREWSPAQERGLFGGIFNAGSLVGPAIGSVVAAYLIQSLGWRGSFVVLGVVGIVFAVVWFGVYARPEKARWLRPAERAFILASRETAEADSRGAAITIRSFLRRSTTWGLLVTHGCAVYCQYLFLTFLPVYLANVRGLKDLSTGWAAGGAYGLATVLSLATVAIADRWVRRQGAAAELRTRRRGLVVTVLLGLPLALLPLVGSTALIIIIVAWVLSFALSAIALNWALANTLLTDRRSVGRLFALIAVGGNTLGLLAPLATGYLVDWTGSYAMPFLLAALLLVVGAGATLLLSRHHLGADLEMAERRPAPESR
ncbi:MFS transporter [Pseudonocardia sp. GCM10023141]|uniref:MFS transporter n=1 Tax=Pseudonocardia sp. GCM10023141 TaxID=3252653 RepID=UPI0036164BFA